MSVTEVKGDPLWVLIETGSNQDFIFQSQRRRFQVGASALLTDLPTWVDNALSEVSGVEKVVSTSGKAMLLVGDRETGLSFVSKVTEAACIAAPGLDVWGYVETEDRRGADVMDAERLRELHAAHAQQRWLRPSPRQRFPVRPFIDTCVVTGMPAVTVKEIPGEDRKVPIAAITDRILVRAEKRTGELRRRERFGEAVLSDQKEDVLNAGWVAVVHADGNGVGKIIQSIRDKNQFREFSSALQEVTDKAFADAVGTVEDRKDWLVPLIIGGDDVTFLCDARVALQVTKSYLEAFEKYTGGNDSIKSVAESSALGRAYLTAAAGVAFVKPHFPFHAAYALAEELATQAKSAKELAPGRSSFDFHVLHDSVIGSLRGIRKQLMTKDADGKELNLWPGPFLVESAHGGVGATPWSESREEAHLEQGIEVLLKRRDEQVLSGTAAHALREALLQGGTAIDQTRVRIEARSRRREDVKSFLDTHLAYVEDPKQPEDPEHPEPKFSRLIAILDAADVRTGVSSGERGGARPQGSAADQEAHHA